MPRVKTYYKIIAPANYEFVTFGYFQSDAEKIYPFGFNQIRDHMKRTGGKYANHSQTGTCDMCGHHNDYGVIFHHKVNNSYIVMGMDCCKKPEFNFGRNGDSFRRQITFTIKKNRDNMRSEMLFINKGMEQALKIYKEQGNKPFEENFISNIVKTVIKLGFMTDKQEIYIKNLLMKINNRPVNYPNPNISKHIGEVGERRDFTVTVCDTFIMKKAPYSPHITIMTDPTGNVLFYKGKKFMGSVGDIINFTATIKEHDRYQDMKQTVIYRYTKLSVVTRSKTYR